MYVQHAFSKEAIFVAYGKDAVEAQNKLRKMLKDKFAIIDNRIWGLKVPLERFIPKFFLKCIAVLVVKIVNDDKPRYKSDKFII